MIPDDVPSSASYALNLLHAREILNDYEGALKAGERALEFIDRV